MNNREVWDKASKPPREVLKQIGGGRLKGMTDINPQWRYEIMTELFGICGIGWKYEIVDVWNSPATGGQLFAFAKINLYVSKDGAWSSPIPGIGGSMLIEDSKNSLYSNDEGYKMAITDALSVAMKMLGVGADIYYGRWDGTKYREKQIDVKPLSGVAEEYKDKNPEDYEFLRGLAAELVQFVEIENNAHAAFDHLAGQHLDAEQNLALWAILAPNSKTRNEIKKEKEGRKKRMEATNFLPSCNLDGA